MQIRKRGPSELQWPFLKISGRVGGGWGETIAHDLQLPPIMF